MAIYALIGIFTILILFYFFGYKSVVTESATTSQNIANNAYMTNVDTKLDDLINKIKTVKDMYENLNPVLQFGLIEKNPDPTADPEIYITGTPPNQIIHLKMPQGLTGPLGCQGDRGNTGKPGSKGDLGNQGRNGLNVVPKLISNNPLMSIE